MTVGEYLQSATAQLQTAGIKTARLDVLILLEDTFGVDRAQLLAHPERALNQSQIDKLNTKFAQRTAHVPLAYIRGKAMFYGRTFTVDSHTLVPRPESESLIDLLKQIQPLTDKVRIADIGTGSGCLGLTAALELPNAAVELYDIDPNALAVARKNARLLGAHHAKIGQSDLLEHADTEHTYDVLLANLPYVPNAYPINQAAGHEPALALFAGQDGMDLYQRFWRQVGELTHPPRHIITESLPIQHAPQRSLAKSQGYKLQQTLGLAQLFSSDGPVIRQARHPR